MVSGGCLGCFDHSNNVMMITTIMIMIKNNHNDTNDDSNTIMTANNLLPINTIRIMKFQSGSFT